MSQPPDPRTARLRALVVEYLERRASGEALDEATFCRAHLDVAEALQGLLASFRGGAVSDVPADLEGWLGDEGATLRSDPKTRRSGGAEAGEEDLADAGSTLAEQRSGGTVLRSVHGLAGPPQEKPPDMPAGELFDDRYRVLRELGAGGFGKVLLVEDTLHRGKRRALKVLHAELRKEPEFDERFRNEINIDRSLEHPGIPKIFNDGLTAAGEFYYTMEYVEGPTLEQVLKETGNLGPQRIVSIVRQLISVLEHAHAKGVVHRDLKPGNIILVNAGTSDEQVKVLDFGIAKILKREGLLEDAQTMATSIPMGTPHYMAPEQVRGGKIDARTDYYALGVMIYRMVSRRFPFEGKTAMEIASKRLEEDPAPLEVSEADAPPHLVHLVRSLLAREMEQRPSPEEIHRILDGMVHGQRQLARAGKWLALAAGLVIAFLALQMLRGEGARARNRESSTEADLKQSDQHKGPGPEPVTSPGPSQGDLVAVPLTLVSEPQLEEFHRSPDGVEVRGTVSRVEPGLELYVEGPTGESKEVQLVLEGTKFSAAPSLVEDGTYTLRLKAPGADLWTGTVRVDRTSPTLTNLDLGSPGRHDEEGNVCYVQDANCELVFDGDEEGLAFNWWRDDIEYAPTSITPSATEGKHRVRVEGLTANDESRVVIRATDRAGNESEALELTLVYVPGPPSLELRLDGNLSAGEDYETAHDTVDLLISRAADSPDVDDVAVELNGEKLGGATLGKSFSIPLREVRQNELVVRATGKDGRVAKVDATITKKKAEAEVSELRVNGRLANRTERGFELELGYSEATPALVIKATQALDAAEVGGKQMDFAGEMEIKVDLGAVGPGGQLVVPIRLTGMNGMTSEIELVLHRKEPHLPPGCEAAPGAQIATNGWPDRIRHQGTGMLLVYIDYEGEPFYIGRTEVSGKEYERLVERPKQPAKFTADHPVVNIDKAVAEDWASEAGGRLPTFEEWKYAAGPSTYPWGEEWSPACCNALGAPVMPVDQELACKNAHDLLHMAGNVEEWCTLDQETGRAGGSCRSSQEQCVPAESFKPDSTGRGSQAVGFRILVPAADG